METTLDVIKNHYTSCKGNIEKGDFLQLVAHNLLCVLIKFVVFNATAVEQA